MTDNKLTDNEIIKGIECCASRTFRCDECCYAPFKFNECTPHILNDALDLINRQKTEIEQLKKDKENLAYSFANAVGQKMTAKSEGIKEFVKLLHDKAFHDKNDGEAVVCCCDIDDLAKEMENKING